jgi:hypothetical protein
MIEHHGGWQERAYRGGVELHRQLRKRDDVSARKIKTNTDTR